MKSIEKMLLLAGSCALILSFAGCKEKSSAKTGAASSNVKSVKLTVWESLDGPDQFIKEAGKIYSERNPGVEIKFVNVELGDAAGKIALNGPAGMGPDLFAAPHDKLGELVNGGHILAVNNTEYVKKQALDSCVKAVTYDGVMYGYPVSAETYALFYNKALISENNVPSTWIELADWARQFNEKNPGKYGFVMNSGSSYYTIIFTTMKGNRLFGKDGNDIANTYLDTPEAVEGMKYFQSLNKIWSVPAADLSDAICDAAFQSGKAAMHITGLWNVKNFEKAGIDFGVVPLPALPGESTPAASFSGTRSMFVSAYSDYPEEAAKFAEFLMSDEMQKFRFECTGAMPAVDVEVESKYMKGFLKQLDYAFPMPSIPQMSSFWESMNNASKNIWDGADVKSELSACSTAILSN